MSEFSTKLDKAKSRQKRLYLFASMLVLVILLIVVSLLVVSRGTRVDIIPADAAEHAEISVTNGLGFTLGDTVYSLFGNPVIIASAPGFKDGVETIGHVHLGKVFPLEMFELPGRLRIELAGDPEKLRKTAWRIDGREAAVGQSLDLELVAGAYTVNIDNPFFQLNEVGVEMKRGEMTQLQVSLEPVQGVLILSSTPPGAKVFADEREVGLTPLQLMREGGSYNLKVAAPNYIDVFDDVEVTRTNSEVVRSYNLELEKGRVIVDVKPKGGTLLVNGIQAVEPFLLDATVEHQLTYVKPGFYPEIQEVTLEAGEEKQISFNLKEEIGKVEISSSPQAQIFIGKREYGLTPLNLDLPAITQKITFKKQGYRTVSKSVQPRGNKVQKVSATLLTEYQARLQEAPREFTNSIGIKLKLFIVRDNITIGAPRSEKGQRANEFQRRIHLTRPFYASLHEITNRQFASFRSQPAGSGPTNPVTGISWQEAATFCNWLSAQEKLSPFYTMAGGRVSGFNAFSDGYRLLSEGEWEWLARKAGKKERTTFSWGNDTVIPPNAANIGDESARGQVRFYVPNYRDGFAGVAPVGSMAREPSGLYDLAGNVSEWVHDVYSIVPPQAGTTQKNPLGQQRGTSHVVKGANFRSGTLTGLRPAFREGLSAGRDDVGFRIGRYLYGGPNE
ncbi:MAG: SUMF1/EgtB/PvdO family nonheme iron enzyme [Desulfocapsaceae bacterium]|nr:SUMF1/EgtB/PvdO family nonheme iron enzyme [Desulfocapsaceae bacterium]